jgi:hypothetical protein
MAAESWPATRDAMKQALALALAVVTLTIASPISTATASDPSKPAAPPFLVHLQLDAEVSRVNRDTGVLLLRTDAGRLTLDAAGRATDVLNDGDRVVLDITAMRHADPAPIPPGDRARAPLLVRRLPAHVTAVQRAIGTVSLKTPAGRLDVDLPPAVVTDLRTGDQLALAVTVLQDVDAAALPRLESERRAGVLRFLLGIFGAARGGARPGQ